MNSIPSTRAQEQAPHTRWGGPLTLRGVEYATTGELMQALADATRDAGGTYRVRLTRRGRSLARALAAEVGR